MNKSGFSLIELMVVIAIVAVLAVVVIPLYRDNKIRSIVTSALPLLDKMKSEFILKHHKGVVWGQGYVYTINPGDSNKPKGVYATATGWYGCLEITFLIPEAGITNTGGNALIMESCPVNSGGAIYWNNGYHLNSNINYVKYLPIPYQQVSGTAATWDTSF
jgi:prepilin-type N-terminal cleavage/methylation domain-containing protein